MNRRNLIIGLFASLPLAVLSNKKFILARQTTKGFVVKAGEARFGIHYKMRGVTMNMLNIKISGDDTEGNLAVFEQTGLTPHG